MSTRRRLHGVKMGVEKAANVTGVTMTKVVVAKVRMGLNVPSPPRLMQLLALTTTMETLAAAVILDGGGKSEM